MSQRTVCVADGRAHQRCWPKHELPLLRRVANVLREAGLCVETESGVTDEGDPWFVFADTESGDVIAHIASINGGYVVCAPFLNGPLTGPVFSDLVAHFLDRCPRKRMAAYTSHSTPAA